ncbi:MAG: LCP family protein [Anaerolineales bacterium]|nr:LCP family protein [Anaerolineales bacterium]
MTFSKSLLLFLALSVLAACAPATPLVTSAPPTISPVPPTAKPAVSVANAAPIDPTTPPIRPTLTGTPTAQPINQPTLGYYNITPMANATLVTPFPTPLPSIKLDEGIINVLLIGTDYRPYISQNYRTDTLIIVSVNTASGLVTMVSIPRDLFVYVPLWGMTRINTAFDAGERINYPGGGAALLKQTLLYNLGVPIHYYALINFDGFRQIVDTLGGVEVAVNCELTEYKLKSPELDERLTENYELYNQPIGVAQMNGDVALWYARARPVGGDYFRSYRQRQVLRAILRAARSANLIPQIPSLYSDFQDVVTTDLGLWDAMQFAPLATKLEDAQLRSFAIGPNQTTPWLTPRGDDVLLPKAEALQRLMAEAFTPPSANQLQRPLMRVEVVNASGNIGWELLAAETLRNEGFVPVLNTETVLTQTNTLLVDYTTTAKGSPLKTLQTVLHVADANVTPQPTADNAVQFRVVLGQDYGTCPRLDWVADK